MSFYVINLWHQNHPNQHNKAQLWTLFPVPYVSYTFIHIYVGVIILYSLSLNCANANIRWQNFPPKSRNKVKSLIACLASPVSVSVSFAISVSFGAAMMEVINGVVVDAVVVAQHWQ